MEVFTVGISSAQFQQPKLFAHHNFCNLKAILGRSRKIAHCSARIPRCQAARQRIQSEISQSKPLQPEEFHSKLPSSLLDANSRQKDHTQLYVGLPLDAVSNSNNINHAKAIAAGLKALKLLGVSGVELPIWWGIVEKEVQGKYNWGGYLALTEMVRDAGLKLRVSLCFHASLHPVIPLPLWVTRIGGMQPDIFFTDRSGKRYRECLSLSIDELPVLEGKTPLQIFQKFMNSFKSSFSGFLGSTIKEMSIGLGPDGELKYPSFPSYTRSRDSPGAGEFQCYDMHMLNHLKKHAEACGNPLWGLSGPHNAPNYDESPISNSFFKEHEGSWETPYGDFFLSWYSTQLLSHGNQLLGLAASVFHGLPVIISGKVPLAHSFYKLRSHPSELTAGFYNTTSRDGYDAVVDMFARNSARLILPETELSDHNLPQGSHSSPDSLFSHIEGLCRRHGVELSGESSVSVFHPSSRFQIIKEKLPSLSCFTYERMGTIFFASEHFPSFCQFVRSLRYRELHAGGWISDDEDEESCQILTPIEHNFQLQVA